jgi:hypothetical protein
MKIHEERVGGMQKYFTTFFVLMVFESIFTPIGIMLAYLTGINFFFSIPKFPLILMFLLSVIFSFQFRLKINFIVVLFLLILPYAFFFGAHSNQISKPFFSHIYGLFMPVFCISFGQNFARYSTFQTRNKIYTTFVNNYKYLVIIILLYFSIYSAGLINYFGMSTYTAYYVAIFSSVNNVFSAVGALVLTLFTGKRAILLGGLIVLIAYIFFSKNTNENSRLRLVKGFIVLFFPILVFVAASLGFLNRFENTINVDFGDERSLYMASGGRSLEIFSILEHIDTQDILLSGGGFGETYLLPELDSRDSIRVMHYSHMSPLYLTLVYGLPFTILCYLYFFIILFKSLFLKRIDFFFLVYLMLFSTAFAGSVLFVDPKFWFFLGCVIGSQKYDACLTLR